MSKDIVIQLDDAPNYLAPEILGITLTHKVVKGGTLEEILSRLARPCFLRIRIKKNKVRIRTYASWYGRHTDWYRRC